MKKTIAILTLIATLGFVNANKCEIVHLASDSVAEFDAQSSSGIVILDFFAQWCPPCKKFGPIFEKASTKAANTSTKFIKIDVEQFINLTNKFGVRSMPTIVALKDGKEIKRHIGGFSEPQFDKWLADIK